MSQRNTSRSRPVRATITIEFDSNISNDQLRRSTFYRNLLRRLDPKNVRVEDISIYRPTQG